MQIYIRYLGGGCVVSYKFNCSRLPLDGAYNVRELGGYPTDTGSMTKYHRFLRGDSLSNLSDKDKAFLWDYGVRMIIDLRSEGQIQDSDRSVIGIDGITYVQCSLMGQDLTDLSKITPEQYNKGLALIYEDILENKKAIEFIFNSMAEQDGCILFHCSAGKDRTGVLAMLLMDLAGVDKYDCAANYEQSHTNMCRKNGYIEGAKKDYGKYIYFMFSVPETIITCYDRIIEQYGSIRNFLIECGLTDETINSVGAHLLNQ